MKVKNLIEALTSEDPEAEVCIGYNYGDYWHTTVTPEVEYVDIGYVKQSAYHDMLALSKDDDEEFDEDGVTTAPDGTQRVVILSNKGIY